MSSFLDRMKGLGFRSLPPFFRFELFASSVHGELLFLLGFCDNELSQKLNLLLEHKEFGFTVEFID